MQSFFEPSIEEPRIANQNFKRKNTTRSMTILYRFCGKMLYYFELKAKSWSYQKQQQLFLPDKFIFLIPTCGNLIIFPSEIFSGFLFFFSGLMAFIFHDFFFLFRSIALQLPSIYFFMCRSMVSILCEIFVLLCIILVFRVLLSNIIMKFEIIFLEVLINSDTLKGLLPHYISRISLKNVDFHIIFIHAFNIVLCVGKSYQKNFGKYLFC